jgi:tetratricopeptide (TPR) repeat protein
MDLGDNMTESQWDSLRAALIVGGLALIGGLGYWIGQPAWAHWQSRQALAQSRAFEAKKDIPSMLLALRRATLLAPRDRFVWEETARELAEIGSPEELTAREELTRLRPGDRLVQLAFAQEALRFGRIDTAKTALDAVDDSAKNDLAYQRLAVRLAVAQGQPDDLRLQLSKLIKLEPANANARFTLAALNLWSSDADAAEAARRDLDALLDDPAVRIRAAIELVSEAARHGTPLRVHQVIGRCLSVFAPGSAAEQTHSEQQVWEALLGGMKQMAPANATDTALLARWLADLRRRPEALAWLQGMPPALRSSPAVLDLIAQLAAEEKDDTALAAALTDRAWGPWPPDGWKLAIKFRQQTDRPSFAQASAGGPHPIVWPDVIKANGDSLDGLRNLGRLANAWGRPQEAEAAWLGIVDRAPTIKWAYQALESSYLSRQDLNGLLALYNRWAQAFPLDDTIAERWAMVAALLDRVTAATTGRVGGIVATDTLGVLAKAAVLWRRGRPWDAEKILYTLPESDRRGNAGSFWIALTESDLNHREAAADALKLAFGYPRGREERELLLQAAKKVHYQPTPEGGARPPGAL